MSGASWLSWLLASAAGATFAVWVYRRREVPGRGRGALAGLRACTIALLLLLAFDPDLPGAVRSSRDSAIIVDASLSMRMPGEAVTRWETAVTRARAMGATAVTLFGDGTRTLDPEALAGMQPAGLDSRLLPALQAVAEAGGRHATVITDGAIEDADDVARWLPRLGIDVTVDVVPGGAPNRGLTRVAAPAFVGAGEPLTVEFDLSATGGAGGPATVVVRQAGTELARTIVETPAEGRVSTGELSFAAGATTQVGYARYDIEIEADDAIADDDRRSVYVNVTDEPAGAVIVSFIPDWEPRFLQPVLERSLGVPVRGYLRSGQEWVTLGSGMSSGDRVQDTAVRRAVDRAALLVLHGFGSGSPEWAQEAAAAGRHLLVLPAGDGVVPGVPVPPTTAVAGDWYLSPDVPASPVAQQFAGIDVADVPPLQALRSPGGIAGTWAPAVAARGRRGAPQPVAIAGATGGRRWVVALGQGYWRWAFWSEDARDIYERLWSAVGVWALGDVVASGPDAVAPVSRVVSRNARPAWTTYGFQADSVRLLLTDSAGEIATDTLIDAAGPDTLRTRTLPPGTYDYVASAWSGSDGVTGAGEITVESYSAEFTRAAVAAAGIEGAPESLGTADRSRVPLHASLWPYALLMLLLSVEWIFRRRWGLR
jgi:hypothetical protein